MTHEIVHRMPMFLAVAAAVTAGTSCGERGDELAKAAEPKAHVRRFWEAHDRARDLYVAEDFSAARSAYQKALEIDPRHTASLYNLANSEFHLGHHASALDCLKRLEEVDPYETKPKLLAGVILSDPRPAGPFDLAVAQAMLDRAVEMNREESGPFLLQGRTAVLAGDFPRAEERLRLVLRANPAAPEALNLLGVLALRRGDAAGASKLLLRAIKAAKGAPPPAGLPGEGDTKRGSAGYHRQQLLEAQWLFTSFCSSPPGPASAGPGGDSDGKQAQDVPPPAVLRQVPELPFKARPLVPQSPRSGRAIAIADLDGDGTPEVAVGSLAGPITMSSVNETTITTRATADITGVSFLAAGDLDGDSRQDLYAVRGGDLGAGEPAILLSRGDLRFEEVPVPGGKRRTLGAAVVKTASGAEVIEVGPASTVPAVRVIRRAGAQWTLEKVAGSPEGDCAVAVALLPASPGTTPEAIVAFAHRSPLMFRREAGGWRTVAAPTGLEDLGSVDRLATIDLDNDGTAELAAARSSSAMESLEWLVDGKAASSPVRLLRRVGPDRFEPAPIDLPPFASHVASLAPGDVDGDGAADLVVLGGGPEPWRIEPFWVLLRRGAGFELRRGVLPAGTFSACAAAFLPPARGAPVWILAGGGILPADTGGVFALEPGGS